jgi:long-chain acyl-CoA synthetase
MTNLATALVDAAEQHADRPALRLDEHVLSYADFRDMARAIAESCAAGASSPATGWGWCSPTCPRSRWRSTGR